MSEFKIGIPSDRGRERSIRLITWGTVSMMIGITLFAVYYAHSASPHLSRALGWLAVGIVIVTIVGAQILAASLGLEKFEHDLAFVLTREEVIRKRKGWPDVRIRLADIKALNQRRGWLVVESNEPGTTIAIPDRVEGFEALRTELMKYCPITQTPQRRIWGGYLFGSYGTLLGPGVVV